MKRNIKQYGMVIWLFALCTMLFVSPAHAYQMCTAGTGVGGYSIIENFDGSTACGDGVATNCNNTWTLVGPNIATFNYATSPAPLEGSYSLKLANTGGGNSGYYISYANTDTVHFFGIVDTLVLAGGNNIIKIQSSGGTDLLTVDNANPQWRLYCGTASATGASMTANTIYYVWGDYTKGTGTNAVCHLYYSTTTTKGAADITVTNGTGVSQAARLYLTTDTNTGSVLFDKMRVSTTSIGDNPQ